MSRDSKVIITKFFHETDLLEPRIRLEWSMSLCFFCWTHVVVILESTSVQWSGEKGWFIIVSFLLFSAGTVTPTCLFNIYSHAHLRNPLLVSASHSKIWLCCVTFLSHLWQKQLILSSPLWTIWISMVALE